MPSPCCTPELSSSPQTSYLFFSARGSWPVPRGRGAEWLQLLLGAAVLSDRALTPSQSALGSCLSSCQSAPTHLLNDLALSLLRDLQLGARLVETSTFSCARRWRVTGSGSSVSNLFPRPFVRMGFGYHPLVPLLAPQ